MSDSDGDHYNELLKQWEGRVHRLGRDVGHHPKTIARVVSEMDDEGQSDAADVIHSLVWALVVEQRRSASFVQELERAESRIAEMQSAVDAAGLAAIRSSSIQGISAAAAVRDALREAT